VIAAWLACAALAAPIQKTACFQYAPDSWLAGLEAGDRWTNNNPKAARGIQVRLDRLDVPQSGAWTYAAWNGATPGCLTFTVEDTAEYQLLYWYKAKVNGIILTSYDHPGDPVTPSTEANAALGQRVAATWAGAPGTGLISPNTVTYTLADNAHVPYMAIGSLIFFLNDWSMNEATQVKFYPYLGTPVDVDGDGLFEVEERPMFPTTWGTMWGWATRQGFNIAHEIGHIIAILRAGKMSSAVSCSVGRSPGYFRLNLSGSAAMPDEEGCRAERVAESTDRPKGMLTMEYQAMALREGWADFVSAYTFNYVSQDDCTFGEWGFVKNFDLDDDDKDADVDEGQWDNPIANDHFDYDNASTPGQMVNVAVAPTDGWLSCDGPPLTTALCTAWGMPCNDLTVGPDWEQVPLKAVATGPDWLEGVYGFAGTCGGGLGLTNRSTAYDWARFFWDLATERDVPGRQRHLDHDGRGPVRLGHHRGRRHGATARRRGQHLVFRLPYPGVLERRGRVGG